jgi:hypothetical protein
MERTFHCKTRVKFNDGTEDTLTVFSESADYIIARGRFEFRLPSKRATPMPQALENEISLAFRATVVDTDYTGKRL